MDPLRVTAELLFGLVFVFVGHAYLRRRDAISRDLVLAFAGLGLTFLVDVWRRVAGATPPPIGIAVGGIEALAAALLLLEARRRRGPGAIRLALAAISTALFAVALVSAGVGAVVEEIAPNATAASIVLSLMAAVGYLIAFAPPASV